MNNKPLVSILIPVYNVEKYIERCARSVFEQTYENLDIIFVDDCTPDNSIAVLERVTTDYPNRKDQIRIIHHEHNRGVAAARNTLVAAAKGEYIMFVDSDDWLVLNGVELLVNRQQETNADIVTSRAYWQKAEGIVEYWNGGLSIDKDEIIKRLIDQSFSRSLWRRIIRTSLYRDHHISFCEGVNMGEDALVIIPLFYFAKTISYLDAFTYWHGSDVADSIVSSYPMDYNLQDQLEKAELLISDFFLSKNQSYYVLACIALMRIKQDHMFFAADKNDKERYNLKANEIFLHHEYWPAIKWNLAPLRWIERDYYRYKTFFPLLKLYRWMRTLFMAPNKSSSSLLK